eukprot:1631777-Pyramimonas_sp.AAC.3
MTRWASLAPYLGSAQAALFATPPPPIGGSPVPTAGHFVHGGHPMAALLALHPLLRIRHELVRPLLLGSFVRTVRPSCRLAAPLGSWSGRRVLAQLLQQSHSPAPLVSRLHLCGREWLGRPAAKRARVGVMAALFPKGPSLRLELF